MTPSFCGSVLRTLSTLSSTTYVKRGQDISNTVSQYLESIHKCTNKMKNGESSKLTENEKDAKWSGRTHLYMRGYYGYYCPVRMKIR